MKLIKPALREKKRYLLIAGEDVSKNNIEEAILEFIGILGFAESAPLFIKSDKGHIILAVNRKSLDKIRASFLASGKDIKIVKVSGNIGKLK